MIGETVSHYKILEKLGAGGMGVVYKAEDVELERTVALKFLSSQALGTEEENLRFKHEARAAAALNHPNICTIHEINEFEGRHFIVMEYIDGRSLRELIKAAPLSLEDAIDIAVQISKGLGEAHEKGIVHRDIKAANIMIAAKGQVKITDFGLAKFAAQTQITREGTTLGTTAYMSPEQARGENVDRRTDIWSLGVVLYEMVTGQQPFRGDYEQAVVYSILNEDPEPITSSRSDIPTGLQTIVNKCLAKDPEQRYRKIKDFLEDLMMVEGVDVATATSAAVSGKEKRPYADKKRLWIPIVIAVSVIIGAILVFNFWYVPRRVYERPDSGLLEEGKQIEAPSPVQSVAGFDNSIVVLPFDDISPGKDNEYFSDGLTEEIITDLSRISSLRVISRTSAMNFKGSEKDVRTIGRELNVRYILEGSVRKIDGDLRITAQLIDATTDAHVWADKYRGTLDDVFDIQEKVSRAIVDALKLTLSSEEDETLAQRPIDDAIAFEHYFRAKQEIRKMTAEGLDRARTYIQAGLERIGDNVLLYQGMGLIEWECYSLGLSSDEAYLDSAEGYAARIFELEPDSPRGYFLRGLIDISRGNPHEGAVNLSRVLAVEPKDYDALRWLIVIYSYTGKIASAVSLAERLAEIDPIASDKIFCWIGLMDGSFKNFYECAHELYQEDPNSLAARLHYILAVAYAGELDQFYALVDQLAQEMPEHFAANLFLFMSYAFQERNEEALQVMTSEFQTIAGRSWQYAWHIAAGYAMMDESEKSVEWLESAVNQGFINYPLLAEIDPFLENIRGERIFKDLMKRVKYEWEHFDQ